MLVIAIVGIKITARAQVSMAADRVPDPDRPGDRRPGLRARPPPRHVCRSPRAGSARPGSTARATRWPGSWSRCSSTAAGTAPCTSTRKSSTAASTRAGPPCSPWACSPSCTRCQVGFQGVVSPAKLQAQQRHRAGLRGPRAGRRLLGQGDGAVHRAVRDRHHRHRHRARRPDRLRHGQLPGAAPVPGHRVPPVRHPGRRQRHLRPADRRAQRRSTTWPPRCRTRSST